jgi:hypothetical protein
MLRACARLAYATPGSSGEKSVALAKFKQYEVRLIEFPFRELLWLELFAHDSQTSIDSGACSVLDEAVAMAAHLVQQALDLSEQS